MIRKMIYTALLLLSACGQNPTPETQKIDVHPTYSFKVDKISVSQLVDNLNLSKASEDLSDQGMKRLRWKITDGFKTNQLELIGDPEDAQILSGHCVEFNSDGNSVGWPENGVCNHFFRRISNNMLHNSEPAAQYAIQKAGLNPFQKGDLSLSVEAQHLSLEIYNDGFFFLRNKKKISKP